MWKKIAIVLGVLAVLFVLVGLILPTDFRVTRSTVVQAPPAKIHELTGDLKRWDEWTPWKEHDPSLVVTMGEKTSGVGASQVAKGDGGTVQIRVVKSDPQTGLEYEMAFGEGKDATPAKSWIAYKPAGTGTEVEWGIEGKAPFAIVGGYFALCADMMIGRQFEKGLAKLRTQAEAK